MLHRDYSWLRNTKKMLSTAVHLLRSVLKITVSNIYIVRNILSLYEHARNLFLALIFGLNQFRCTETFNKHVLSSIKLSLEEKNPLGSTRWIYFRLKHRSCRSLQFFLFEIAGDVIHPRLPHVYLFRSRTWIEFFEINARNWHLNHDTRVRYRA